MSKTNGDYLREIIAFIRENEMFDFCELLDYADENGKKAWYNLLSRGDHISGPIVAVTEYIDSARRKRGLPVCYCDVHLEAVADFTRYMASNPGVDHQETLEDEALIAVEDFLEHTGGGSNE